MRKYLWIVLLFGLAGCERSVGTVKTIHAVTKETMTSKTVWFEKDGTMCQRGNEVEMESRQILYLGDDGRVYWKEKP